MNKLSKRSLVLIELCVSLLFLCIVFTILTSLFTLAREKRDTVMLHSEALMLCEDLTERFYAENEVAAPIYLEANGFEKEDSVYTYELVCEGQSVVITAEPEEKTYENGVLYAFTLRCGEEESLFEMRAARYDAVYNADNEADNIR